MQRSNEIRSEDVPNNIKRRFWNKVRVGGPNECWEWRGYKHPRGYGYLCLATSGHYKVHRLSYALHNDVLPANTVVCHRCDNPACVNPNHLFAATQKENIADCIRKGRRVVLRGERRASKLTAEKVIRIRSDVRPQNVIAAEYGIRQDHVSRIKTGKAWSHI
jgi:hypothetical protein